VVFVGFGAGLTWAACAIDWRTPIDKAEANWWKNTRRQATYSAAAARSMWRRAVRWVYDVLPDPEAKGQDARRDREETGGQEGTDEEA
jgi:3-oxoacyl-[acyl-carrier-protein] synthase-3